LLKRSTGVFGDCESPKTHLKRSSVVADDSKSLFPRATVAQKKRRCRRRRTSIPDPMRPELAEAVLTALLNHPNDAGRAEAAFRKVARSQADVDAAMLRFRRAGRGTL
jgi:hypothetical protein